MPFAVERAAGAVVGDTGYMFGGLIPGDTSIATILSIDLGTGVARNVGSIPVAAHDAAAAPLGNEVLLFGGSDPAGPLVQRFDPATGRVATVGHLPRALSDLSTVTIGTRVYVVGGYDGVRARAEVLETADGRSFRTIATLPNGLRYAAVAAAGSNLVIAGGQTQSAAATRSVTVVDTTTGSVRTLAEVPVPLAHAVVVVRGSTAFLIGGRDSAERPTSRVWRISLTSGAVSPAPALVLPLADTTLLVGVASTILAGGATGRSSSGGETRTEVLFT